MDSQNRMSVQSSANHIDATIEIGWVPFEILSNDSVKRPSTASVSPSAWNFPRIMPDANGSESSDGSQAQGLLRANVHFGSKERHCPSSGRRTPSISSAPVALGPISSGLPPRARGTLIGRSATNLRSVHSDCGNEGEHDDGEDEDGDEDEDENEEDELLNNVSVTVPKPANMEAFNLQEVLSQYRFVPGNFQFSTFQVIEVFPFLRHFIKAWPVTEAIRIHLKGKYANKVKKDLRKLRHKRQATLNSGKNTRVAGERYHRRPCSGPRPSATLDRDYRPYTSMMLYSGVDPSRWLQSSLARCGVRAHPSISAADMLWLSVHFRQCPMINYTKNLPNWSTNYFGHMSATSSAKLRTSKSVILYFPSCTTRVFILGLTVIFLPTLADTHFPVITFAMSSSALNNIGVVGGNNSETFTVIDLTRLPSPPSRYTGQSPPPSSQPRHITCGRLNGLLQGRVPPIAAGMLPAPTASVTHARFVCPPGFVESWDLTVTPPQWTIVPIKPELEEPPQPSQSSTTIAQVREALQCSICLDALTHPVSTTCGHTFCAACLLEWCKKEIGAIPCPTCRTYVRYIPTKTYLIQTVASALQQDENNEGDVSEEEWRRVNLVERGAEGEEFRGDNSFPRYYHHIGRYQNRRRPTIVQSDDAPAPTWVVDVLDMDVVWNSG
ncbi:hypothetical protein FISHEDRAFT_60404 [Fistulina hepatica ATCC 64428]|uniref:RING-type domain-containing protein n=1 Tax=Fistulina hepatica ATCC 64428 TaxID=1128425 RepID=A0A0D7A7M5_9AGAR|nr:hypothetical protein FISHEDRAFT_60404 [Fistulina hepatica ATCC 64428]